MTLELELPGPVATYLTAEQAKDSDLLASSFADDAHVRDEENDYHGIDAITAWWREAQVKYQYVVEPLDASTKGETTTLRVRLTGSFPGSPVEVTYSFVVANDNITSLDIS